MINFNKLLIIKITTLVLTVTFTVTSLTYGIDLPSRVLLRVPLNTTQTKSRLADSIDIIANSNNGGPVKRAEKDAIGKLPVATISRRDFISKIWPPIAMAGVTTVLPGYSILGNLSSSETQIDKQILEKFLKAISIFDKEIQEIIMGKPNIEQLMKGLKFYNFESYIIPTLLYLDDPEKQKFILDNIDLMYWIESKAEGSIFMTIQTIWDMEIVDGELQISAY
jgi:hypothetical protein